MFCVAGVMAGKLVDTIKNVSLHWGGGDMLYCYFRSLAYSCFKLQANLKVKIGCVRAKTNSITLSLGI